MSNDAVLRVANSDTAKGRADAIRKLASQMWDLLITAWHARDWEALGYPTWDAYCEGEFGASRIKIPKEERQEIVGSMREAGMSIPAIASATGMSYGTAQAAAQGVKVDRVTGTDGKTYTSSSPAAFASPSLAPGTPGWDDSVRRVRELMDQAAQALRDYETFVIDAVAGMTPHEIMMKASDVDRPWQELYAILQGYPYRDEYDEILDFWEPPYPTDLINAVQHKINQRLATRTTPGAPRIEESRLYWVVVCTHAIITVAGGLARDQLDQQRIDLAWLGMDIHFHISLPNFAPTALSGGDELISRLCAYYRVDEPSLDDVIFAGRTTIDPEYVERVTSGGDHSET